MSDPEHPPTVDPRLAPESRKNAAARYCLLDAGLPDEVTAALTRHFDPDPDIEVMVERRRRERRSEGDRRHQAALFAAERRLVNNPQGRRVGERRARLLACDATELPAPFRPWADRLAVVEREAVSRERLEDLEDLRLVTRLQAGERSAFEELYHRYLARFQAYAGAALGDPHEAEDVVQEVFLKMLRSVPRFELRGVPFRVWLFRVLRNHIRHHIAKTHRVVLEEPAQLAERIEPLGPPDGEEAFERISDVDFLQRIEGLPDSQRKVLALRFLFGMAPAEIAKLLDSSPNAVANVQYRALGSLRSELGDPSEAEPGPRLNLPMRRLRLASGVGRRWRPAYLV